MVTEWGFKNILVLCSIKWCHAWSWSGNQARQHLKYNTEVPKATRISQLWNSYEVSSAEGWPPELKDVEHLKEKRCLRGSCILWIKLNKSNLEASLGPWSFENGHRVHCGLHQWYPQFNSQQQWCITTKYSLPLWEEPGSVQHIRTLHCDAEMLNQLLRVLSLLVNALQSKYNKEAGVGPYLKKILEASLKKRIKDKLKNNSISSLLIWLMQLHIAHKGAHILSKPSSSWLTEKMWPLEINQIEFQRHL